MVAFVNLKKNCYLARDVFRIPNLLIPKAMITKRKQKGMGAALLLVACVLAFPSNHLNAQQSDKSYYFDETFVYAISNEEAERLQNSNSADSVMLGMLHTPVASFRGNWDKWPDKGHFIFVNFSKNKTYYNYVPVMPFQVFFFHEYDRITLQVVDSLGNVRENAGVNMKGVASRYEMKIPFDRISRTYSIQEETFPYRDKKWYIEVQLDGFSALFDLTKPYNPFPNKKEERNAEKNRVRYQEKEFYSYLITDKQKYKPNETVRFKSYALSEQRKPMQEALDLVVNDKRIGAVQPYHPGGYADEVVLHDSLELKLDRNYTVQLRNAKGRVVASTHFRYEDYALIDGRVEAKVSDKVHYYPDTNRLEISGWDVNGLRLQYASADICIKRRSVAASFSDLLVLPDTLLQTTVSLDNEEPTLFDIPASLLAASNCLYDVSVRVYTADNQIFDQVISGVPYYKSQQKIKTSLQNDSICFVFEALGKVKPVKALLRYDDRETAKEIELPYKEPFRQSVRKYGIQVAEPPLLHYSYTADLKSDMQVEGGFSHDSLHIRLVNPHRFDVIWYVYEANKLIHKGNGKELDYSVPGVDFDKKYLAEIFYYIGNKKQRIEKQFVPRKEWLRVDIDMPERIFPGQTTDAVITVSDYMGMPVGHTDLTALAVDSRMESRIREVPYFGVFPQERDYHFGYDMKEYEASDWSRPLDVAFWNEKATSDTLFARLQDFIRDASDEEPSPDRSGDFADVWTPTEIRVQDKPWNLLFRLPKYTDTVGVAYLLFQNSQTGALIMPNEMTSVLLKYPDIPAAVYDAVLLYNDGRYVRFDSVPIKPYSYIDVNMKNLPVQPKDSRSETWLSQRMKIMNYDYYVREIADKRRESAKVDSPFKPVKVRQGVGRIQVTDRGVEGVVTGIVWDSEGSPLPGATVSIVETNRNATTNMDGEFEIVVNQSDVLLRVSYLGFLPQTVMVNSGSFINVVMEEDMDKLSEVTVVAFGKQKKQSVVGSATIVDPKELSVPENDLSDARAGRLSAEERLYDELLHLSSLRSDFRDVAFWEPRLVTNQSGKAGFKVTFPDNITQWNSVVYAMNTMLQTGMGRKNIRSYKPLMAELKTPSFLVRGDRSDYIGSVRNETVDKQSIRGNVLFAIGADTVMRKAIAFDVSHQEKLQVSPASADSLTSTYLFRRDDGFTDGERRTIPVIERGAELVLTGMTEVLERGVRRTITAASDERVELFLYVEQLDVYLDELASLCLYPYDCNEQMASKLIGMLQYKRYCEQTGAQFPHERDIKKIISRLTENRNEQGRWSWWGNAAESSSWMSAHIVRALKTAHKTGYDVNVDFKEAEEEMLRMVQNGKATLQDIELVNALSASGAVGDYPEVVKLFEALIGEYEKPAKQKSAAARPSANEVSYLKEKLLLLELCQKNHVTYSVDNLLKYIHETPSGAMYCDDGTARPWYKDASVTTLIAYRIVRDNPDLQHLVAPMQLYILGGKKNGWNTYTASSAVMTILPDLMKQMGKKELQAKVELFGKTGEVITKFPYKRTLEPGESATVEKQSGIPAFCTVNRLQYVTKARPGDMFDVQTTLNSDVLTAGKAATLTVTVEVKQSLAEHVMIEVPIPAGCGYAEKPEAFRQWWQRNRKEASPESYRESYKEKTVIFCERLPKGTYTFEIELLPRYTGQYSLNPAHVSDMYQPMINANNRLRTILIELHK